MPPTVSVLITCYNREALVGATIESVLASTFQDFEIVVVDDGSRDRSCEVVEGYARRDGRIRLYRNERNLGDYPNRNRAAALAAGRYLKYVDSDDLLYPHCLQVMVDCMEQFPAAALGLAMEPHPDRPFPLQLDPLEAYREHCFGRPVFNKPPLAAILRRDHFEAVGGFPAKRQVGDFELWHVLGARAPVVLMPPGLAWARTHAVQESGEVRDRPAERAEYLKLACELLSRPECPLPPPERSRAVRRVRRGHARWILRMLADRRFGEGWRMYRRSGMGVADVIRFAWTPLR